MAIRPVECAKGGHTPDNNLENVMEQIQSEGGFTGFVRQMRQNSSLLLTVLIATGALLYFIVGMLAILGR